MSSTMEETSNSEVISTISRNVDVSASASSSSCSQNVKAENETIEESKVHWSELSEVDSTVSGVRRPHSTKGKIFSKLKKVVGSALSMVGKSYIDYRIVAENRKVFKTLQLHPQWGEFFVTYEACGSSLLVGEKFAEGAQAEIFNAILKQQDKPDLKCVLKEFKKGSLLQHLQLQWPHGFLQWRGQYIVGGKDTWRSLVTYVRRGILLPNGQFAFLMKKEDEDLRRLIVRNRGKCGHGCGPFEKKIRDNILYDIALGMDWLHKHNVVHRDLKSSNVLITDGSCYVADYECSNGVVGTGFWRDPQILQACKEGNASQRVELFTRAADVYSYGMTCYEILTGNLPFEDEVKNEGHNVIRDLIIEGNRPKVPKYVEDWICELLRLCWQSNREERPTFEEILNVIATRTFDPYIKGSHVFLKKLNNEELQPLLGCNNLSHGLELLEHAPFESGVYTCNLCFEECNGAMYHCSSCGDFNLHPECATIRPDMKSFVHPHELFIIPNFERRGEEITCDACGLEVLKGMYYDFYTCFQKECNFKVHIHCAKYASIISHNFHDEHELVLSYAVTNIIVGRVSLTCNCCMIELDPLEIIYCCIECGFNVHPHCIIGKLECKSW